MKTVKLDGLWRLRGRPQEGPGEEVLLEAQVPGCVLLDLSRAGFLPEDLYFGNNIKEAEPYETYEWWYEKNFDAPSERENVFLVFHGVDCLAEYYLNGQRIGQSENMLVSHEFSVGPYLREGKNTLTVHLSSPVLAAHGEEYGAAAMDSWFPAAETALRRAPHTYGWDIMPRAVSCGLWRSVLLEVRDRISFSQLAFHTTNTDGTLLYEIACPYGDLADLEVEAEGGCGESRFLVNQRVFKGKTGRLPLRIPNPKPWFPHGYGEANVYDGMARIYQKGTLVHEVPFSFGLRTVTLERTDTTDGKNGTFRFLINGVEVFCRGSNWVPLDAFHARDAERYERALALVKDVGCNMLRCWGGNVYEDHAFFDFCDRNGVMVWQDFAMACHYYPQTEKYRRLISEEAAFVVKKLRNHPSIVLWAGDNEVDSMLWSFGRDPEENRITREWIPQAIKPHDPWRPYLPSSPYISAAGARAGARALPEWHLWGPRDYYKSDYYKNSLAHFVSETGYHGCPSPESIRKFISPEKVWPYLNEEWVLHSSDQKEDPSRVLLMEKQVRQLFGQVPDNLEEYALASQISQAEAKKYFIERMRVGRPYKTGVLWWNLLDGWPQMSDAVVDYYFQKKLAYAYIKRSQAPFTVAADEISSWNLRLYACNDTLEVAVGRLTVTDGETDETLLCKDFSAAPNGTTEIAALPIFYSEHRMLLFTWEQNGRKGRNHYLCGYPPFSFEKYRALLEKHDLASDAF